VWARRRWLVRAKNQGFETFIAAAAEVFINWHVNLDKEFGNPNDKPEGSFVFQLIYQNATT